MSRIGKLPIPVPAGVEVKIDGQVVEVKGPKGTLTHTVPAPIAVALEESTVVVTRPNDERLARSLHGLTRTLIANNIQGVTEGFTKGLEIVGTGYRVAAKGSALEFALGYSHPITVEPPAGISFSVDGNTKITVHGIDKQAVGQFAAEIRRWRKPEPYKGKGIAYRGEFIFRKEGKKK